MKVHTLTHKQIFSLYTQTDTHFPSTHTLTHKLILTLPLHTRTFVLSKIMYIARDPTTESLKTILDSISLSATMEVTAVKDIKPAAQWEIQHQEFSIQEQALKLDTDLQLSEDDSSTYIQDITKIPVTRAPSFDEHHPSCAAHDQDADNAGISFLTESAWDTEQGIQGALAQTPAMSLDEQSSTDCTISLASSSEYLPSISNGYESIQGRTESIRSDGYIPVDASTVNSTTSASSNWPSTNTDHPHSPTDSDPKLVQQTTTSFLLGSMVTGKEVPALTAEHSTSGFLSSTSHDEQHQL